MHLVIGFINVMLGHFLATVYRALRFDFIGRSVIRRCCSAFMAGAGLDDAAVEVMCGMGPDGIRLLEAEAQSRGKHSIAHLVLDILRKSGHA